MSDDNTNKKVSGWLILGIIFLPVIFAWITLQKGYGTNAKIISFVWMVLFVIGTYGASNNPGSNYGSGTVNSGSSGITSSNTNNSGTVSQHKPDLEVIEHDIVFEDPFYYVVGKVRNNRRSQYSYVQVSANLYDSEGNQISNALANTNNLASGSVWAFKAMSFDAKDVASYKIADVTGW